MKPLVYVAGPYTNPDPIQNTRTAIEAADVLYQFEGVVPVVPHLSLLWHFVSPHPVDFWYEYDHQVLLRCDAIFRIEGESTGADAEVRLAEEHNIPIFGPYVDVHFREWVKSQSTVS
jgi:hypothetical protein